ncbi:hypothetical protein ABID58_002600 [Bradyrhizobium sp. S3.2.6]
MQYSRDSEVYNNRRGVLDRPPSRATTAVGVAQTAVALANST